MKYALKGLLIASAIGMISTQSSATDSPPPAYQEVNPQAYIQDIAMLSDAAISERLLENFSKFDIDFDGIGTFLVNNLGFDILDENPGADVRVGIDSRDGQVKVIRDAVHNLTFAHENGFRLKSLHTRYQQRLIGLFK